jgi:Tol biopolymer transport system component
MRPWLCTLALILSLAVGVASGFGGASAKVDAQSGVKFGGAVWSPTRSEIAFWVKTDAQPVCGTPGEAAPTELVFVVRHDGSSLRQIVPQRDAPSWWKQRSWSASPAHLWSPDGNRLALTLHTPSPHTEDLSAVIATRWGKLDFTDFFAEPTSWAPDSRRLAVYEYDPTNSPTGPAVFDSRDGHLQEIGPYPSNDLAWSPRGELVAYEHGGFLYVERPNGTHRHRLVRGGDWDWSWGDTKLLWSGDGKLLAFERFTRKKGWSSGFVIQPDGRNAQRMPGGPTDWAWSPRGRTYAFGRELYDLNTHRGWRVLPRTIAPTKPIWSPNGQRLAYPGRHSLFVVDRDGRHGHTVRWPEAPRVSDPSWSHDSRTLTFATEDGVYVIDADGHNGRYVPVDLCSATTTRH